MRPRMNTTSSESVSPVRCSRTWNGASCARTRRTRWCSSGGTSGTSAQFRELVAEVKSLAPGKPPLFMIDEEGGRVDRLRNILPGLPSVRGFRRRGSRRPSCREWFGKVIGMALRYFDIEIDLAPVVDIRGEVAPKGLERRTFGSDPETVVELAGAFMRGLHGAGVAVVPQALAGHRRRLRRSALRRDGDRRRRSSSSWSASSCRSRASATRPARS